MRGVGWRQAPPTTDYGSWHLLIAAVAQLHQVEPELIRHVCSFLESLTVAPRTMGEALAQPEALLGARALPQHVDRLQPKCVLR